MRKARLAHWVFAATLIALGIMGLVSADLTGLWAPVPKAWPGRAALVWMCALVCLGAGAGLLWRGSAALAARVLLAWLLLWVLVFRVRVIVLAPGSMDTWENCAETVVVLAGAWTLYAGTANAWDRRHLGFAAGEPGLRIARTLFGASLIAFGAAHFAYLKETASLVPAWLPGHPGWAYFTGGAYIAAGVAIIAGVLARLAASLATLQIAGFTFLVWAPIAAAGHPSAFAWSETVISWTLTAAAWVIADSYRGRRWLRLR
ncbi:MAG TPA: hypothetical protein VGN38_10275 [Caulobacteraceae bacterium]|jgi:uncharacterized membrane protein YphA (DoxX/SURF4 family)|nr:hypothetical protein [Caulobacteraceae bacterium]